VLSKEDTELLCRVGRGTPMGELMRQYWMPVLYTWEIESDGAPQRVRVLGEDLIAFRDSDGNPGFVAENCPHRGASLFFGRNEEAGLRCVYHGWKFDTSGACVDMPNEPPESNFKAKVRVNAYAGADFGGMTWVYMGPNQDAPPPVPRFEWGLVPDGQRKHSHKVMYECNWMQALEGEFDTTHVYFLHARLNPEGSPTYGAYVEDKAAKLEVVDTDYGVMYAGRRVEDVGGEEQIYYRTTQFLFPIYGMFPGGSDDGTVPLSIYLPVDDEHTIHMGVFWHPSTPYPGDGRPDFTAPKESGELIRGVGPMKPEQHGRPYSRWWPVLNKENEWGMRRDIQKSENFTGIAGIRLQDHAVITSMGAIMDRTREHLGTADAAIIRVRRRLIAAAKALRDEGTIPPGAVNPEFYTRRSCLAMLPPEVKWMDALTGWHNATTTEHPTGPFFAKRRYMEQLSQRERA
jgi:phthalate 4,5-dioxygenase oxygenase subunit